MANFRLSRDIAFLGGDLTVNAAEALHNFLLTLQANQGRLTVDLRGAEAWDSSSLQLLFAFIKSRPPRTVVWRNMPPEMAADIRLMGFGNLLNEVSHER